MQNLSKSLYDYHIRLDGVFVGLLFVLVYSCLNTLFFEPAIIRVPQVIEHQVVVKVPVKLDVNDKKQIKCLAENTYYEAGNQSVKGKIAVNNVVMNRVNNNFADTPCGVIKQKLRGNCQFSWVCQGKKPISNIDTYAESYKVAENVYLNNLNDVTEGAVFYHADYVDPAWSRIYHRTVQIGQHIFYK
jgi:spore germination cell wall hydrolase CwlJ-like protein